MCCILAVEMVIEAQTVGWMLSYQLGVSSCPGEDFSFPGTEGKRPEKGWLERIMNGYLEELVSLQATDEDIFRAVTPVRSPPFCGTLPPVTSC